jgi:hypothetical protein
MWLILLGTVLLEGKARAGQPAEEDEGEVLYNGIRPPAEWPPKLERFEPDTMRVPYLVDPPNVIPIDVGRQLLVDDFLIESTTLKRTFHRPTYYEDNPILRPEKPWEMTGRGPMAIPHSGGVCYDPEDQLFKMWYITGYQEGVGLVFSKDGIHWERPVFDHVRPGSNMVYDRRPRASTVWHDLATSDPAKRFVMFSTSKHGGVRWVPGRIDTLHMKSTRKQFIVQPDGSQARLLAEGGHECFSPDGRSLLVCDPKGGDPSKWLGMGRSGSSATPISATTASILPSWPPAVCN